MKYADFTGAASRAEYWWFVLFVGLVSAATYVIDYRLALVALLATLLPLLAVGAHRLHEVGRNGWLQLFGLVPIAGLIIVAVYMAEEKKA